VRRHEAGRRYNRRRRLTAVGAAIAVAAVPALAAASTGSVPIKNGYYASLVGVPSADVEFHARSGGKTIPDLVLVCLPADASILAGTGSGSIEVKAPKLRIQGGHFSYTGKAVVTAAFGGATKLTTSTLRINAHHVNGPVRHYTYEGNQLQETTAWLGTVSSPACHHVSAGGHLKLFGPVPGE
jgi:hypothetical protein